MLWAEFVGARGRIGLKARMHSSIVVIDTEIGSGELSGGGGICRSWGGGCRSLRASSASVASEHKTQTAPETSPSDSLFSTVALMLRASDLLFAAHRVGGVYRRGLGLDKLC